MKFKWTILYVPDVVAAVSFYERAFGLTQKFIHESNQYAEMNTGNTILAFTSDELAQSNFDLVYSKNIPSSAPAAVEIAFITDNVQAAYEKALTAGAVSLLPPTEKPWGQTVAYVRDLNGVIVDISTEVAQ